MTTNLVETALLPPGFRVPASRWTDPATRLRELLDSEPFVFAPGVFDPHGAELAMYHGARAVYFSGYSFAIGHLGTTDMDLYSGPEIADAARRTVSALRKFQLTMAVGDPEKGVPPTHLEIPPVVVDMDGGYGNLFNVQRVTELYVNAGVAGAHLEDQVLPKRCGHIAGKALISADEMVGKLRMARAVADDLGRSDFVLIARTDAVSAVDAPEGMRGLDLAIERALRYLDSGAPDVVWCEFPNSDREPTVRFAQEVRRRFPKAMLGFNWSSSFKWFNDPDPTGFAELGELGWIGRKRPKMVVVQATGCAPLVRAFEQGAEHAEPWKDAATIAAGIRVPSAIGDYLVLKAVREGGGTALAVSDDDIRQAQGEIAREVGLYTGPEGAATWAALGRLRETGYLNGNEDVVLFATSIGTKY